MKKTILFCGAMMTAALFMTACSEDEITVSSPNNKWEELIGVTADSNQDWITAVSVKLNIEAEPGSLVTAFTIGDEIPTILGQKEMKGNGVMKLDIPQGIGDSFGLMCSNGSYTEYKRIYLTGEKSFTEDAKFVDTKATTRSVSATETISRATPHDPSLDGSSFYGTTGYSSFGGWAWESLATALPEGQNVKNNSDIIYDYEFESNGPMYISFLYGYTGNYGSRVLGYYYHSKGTYDDIVYVDISETLKYDYIDGLAKVQYQLDGNTNIWYDANFDYRDGDGLSVNKRTTTQTARQGDNAYNTLLVHKEYESRISAMRGLTFKVDVPVGKEFGFYLKLIGTSFTNEQRQNMINEGVPADRLPDVETNFTHMAFNTTGNAGQHRSGMRSYDNFTFMGLDDATKVGDMDCNDVTFGLLNEYGQPYSDKPMKVQSWTIGYEDMGMEQDFDFNDVVIQVTPNTYLHTAEVKLLAKGGTLNTELYYGNQQLCVVHEAMNVPQKSMINTSDDNASIAPVVIASDLSWPDGYTMTDNSNLFKIKATREDGTIVTVSTDSYLQNDRVPQAVCIAGDWAWPKEKTNISTAYPIIGQWGQNVKDQSYWNWYTSFIQEHIVNPYSE